METTTRYGQEKITLSMAQSTLATDFNAWYSSWKGTPPTASSNLTRIPSTAIKSFDPAAPRKFMIFHRFPTEIRLKIWGHARPGPRIIELDYSEEIKHLVSHQSPPALLHACHESREVALKDFKIFFDPKWWTPLGPLPLIYIDPALDTFYMKEMRFQENEGWPERNLFAPQKCILDDLRRSSMFPLRRLSLKYQFLRDYILDDNMLVLTTLLFFLVLETLTIVFDDFHILPSKELAFRDPSSTTISPYEPGADKISLSARMLFIDRVLGCNFPDRPAKLLELLTETRERLKILKECSTNFSWQLPTVEIKVLERYGLQ